jgi:hypothetical protein
MFSPFSQFASYDLFLATCPKEKKATIPTITSKNMALVQALAFQMNFGLTIMTMRMHARAVIIHQTMTIAKMNFFKDNSSDNCNNSIKKLKILNKKKFFIQKKNSIKKKNKKIKNCTIKKFLKKKNSGCVTR